MSVASIIRALFGREDATAAALDEVQVAASETGNRSMVGRLRRELAQHPSRGLTPATLYSILEAAEAGELRAQHELGADMEEKDPQIQSDLGKRRQACAELDWDVAPPENPTPAEQKAADQAAEVMHSIEVEDLLVELGDGILHGWVNMSIPWHTDGAARIFGQPNWEPHGHFRTHPDDPNRLMLRDGSRTGEALWPMGWVEHRHRAKSGYLARMGLLRVLCWPYLFQNYAMGDLAELLEILGIPVRLGKYPAATATQTEKTTLLRAITEMGHSAAGIIPDTMAVELLQAASGSEKPFETMLRWCERSKSKAILGGTLTTGTDEGGAYALGAIHERGLASLVANDAKQYAGSIRRYLLWPMAALNYGILDLERAPRLSIDTALTLDMKVISEALPKLVGLGMQIPVAWAHEQLRIPVADKGEPMLSAGAAPGSAGILPATGSPAVPAGVGQDGLTALAAMDRAKSGTDAQDVIDAEGGRDPGWDQAMALLLRPILAALDQGLSPEDILAKLPEWYGQMDESALLALLDQGVAAADAIGRIEVQAETASLPR